MEIKRKGKWLTLAVPILVCIALLFGWTSPTKTQTKPFKIGYVAGLTGPFAVYNVPYMTGLKYAIEEFNQAGGFAGRPIELITRDGKERPDVSLSEARNLVLAEKVDVLFGGTSSSQVFAVSAFAKEQKIIYLPAPTGADVCGKEGHRYVFKPACMNSSMVGLSVGEFLLDKPWKKYYLMGADYIFGHEALSYAWKRLTEKKPEVTKVGEHWPKFGERDYTSYINSIMAANPEAVIALLPGNFGIDFIRQAKGYDFFKKIQYVNALLTTSDLVPLGKEMPEGMIGLTEYAFPYCGEKYPLAKKIEDRYDRDFNDKNYTNVAMAYNTMLFLREAIRKSGSTDTEKIIRAMEGLETDTALGRIKCLEYSHQGTVPIFIGTAAFGPKYPFAVLKDIKVFQGEKIMPSENEIRKMRGE